MCFWYWQMATDANERGALQGQGDVTAALREAIRCSFPDEPYIGKVTPNDDQLDDPELDEDKDLRDALNGRRWTEVPAKLLHDLPDGYVLLTDEAFVAFLPAWLMRSLEHMDEENEVRNFIVYSFSHTMRQFRVLNPGQQRTVRSILAEFTQRGTCASVGKRATEAVALVDRRRY